MPRVKRRHRTPRRFPRWSACPGVTVTCRKNEPKNGRNVIAAPLDLSEVGARLWVKEPFEVGEEVVLSLEAPGQNARRFIRHLPSWLNVSKRRRRNRNHKPRSSTENPDFNEAQGVRVNKQVRQSM
jgi:hypothetical protein